MILIVCLWNRDLIFVELFDRYLCIWIWLRHYIQLRNFLKLNFILCLKVMLICVIWKCLNIWLSSLLRCYKKKDNTLSRCESQTSTIEALHSEIDYLHSVLNSEKVQKSRLWNPYIVVLKELVNYKLEQDREFQSNLFFYLKEDISKNKITINHLMQKEKDLRKIRDEISYSFPQIQMQYTVFQQEYANFRSSHS